MKQILLIDNYDSFTYNLKALAIACGVGVEVKRNTEIPFENLRDYHGILISPGPGIPEHAGSLKKLLHEVPSSVPVLGVCLGMQAIAEVYGGRLALMEEPLHGLQTLVTHKGDPIFNEIPQEFLVGRYHSWMVANEGMGENIHCLAEDEAGIPMAIQVKDKPIYGVQFHPESVMTPEGKQLMKNFLSKIESKDELTFK